MLDLVLPGDRLTRTLSPSFTENGWTHRLPWCRGMYLQVIANQGTNAAPNTTTTYGFGLALVASLAKQGELVSVAVSLERTLQGQPVQDNATARASLQALDAALGETSTTADLRRFSFVAQSLTFGPQP